MPGKVKVFLDTECLRNYWLVTFLTETGRIAQIDMLDDQVLDIEKIRRILDNKSFTFYSFNGTGYDLPMIRMALTGARPDKLKEASDAIILKDLKPWDFERQHPVAPLSIDHVDLIEVAPGANGLKMYGARLHTRQLQDMPISPDATITPDQVPMIRSYCHNDTLNTSELSIALGGQIHLREIMSQQMNEELRAAGVDHLFGAVDLRSKSDAQIAEVVLRQQVFLATGAIPRRREGTTKAFRYEVPEYVAFRTPQLQEALRTLTDSVFEISDTGHVVMPDAVDKLSITIGPSTFKLGIGGLHSQESRMCHVVGEDEILRDIDVRSYYPNLMLNMGMYPDSMGPNFLTAYRGIVQERLKAKDAGDKVKDASLKITLNGTFGKTSNRYSVLYNPKMMLHTTLTGQLSMLMLIESLHRGRINVVSANTDGIVVRCRRDQEPLLLRIVELWQQITNLETETADYRAIYSRDVNSYVAIKTNGKAKSKGYFALPESDRDRLAKSPQNEICQVAVIKYLTEGKPLEQTIRECEDLTKFITVRKVTGGAVKEGSYLGKVVRWYYSTSTKGVINYAANGNVVPRSVRARPVMLLPDEFPVDIDYDWYIGEATALLSDIGAIPPPPVARLPRRNTKEWKALAEQGLVEVDDYGKPCWAVPYAEVPDKYK